MATRQSGVVLGRILTLFDDGRLGTMSDEQLLERFAARRALAADAGRAAETAFEVLVLRHGPMVLGVCGWVRTGRRFRTRAALRPTTRAAS